MPYLGDYTWNKGTTETVRRICAAFGLEAKKGGAVFTYFGHGGKEESPDRCIDIWTGTSNKALGDKILRWLLPRMVELNIKYVVFWERIYSRTYPEDIFDANGNPKGRPYRHTKANGASDSDSHRNHVHVSCYPGGPKPSEPTAPPAKRPFPVLPEYRDTERLNFRGRRTCICVATSLPWVEYRMLEEDLIKVDIDIFQMGYNAGGVTASAGTHDAGGNTDTSQHTDAHLKVWREMGWTMQRRTPEQGFDLHAHGWPKGCPHLSRGGKNQAAQWERGQNGLASKGKITGPAPVGAKTPNWDDALTAYQRKVGAIAPLPPAPPTKLPTYYVDPAKVTTFLWGVRHSDGERVKQREPGFKIDSGAQIIETAGRRWLLTEAGYRYALDFLTTAKPPAPKPTPKPPTPTPPAEKPESTPVSTETFLSFNTRRSSADVKGYEWAKRKAAAIDVIRDSGASVFGVQECTPRQRRDISAALGTEWFAKGNVAVGWNPKVWTKEHDNFYALETGNDDRYAVAAVLKHKKTGRTLKVASTHLTNLEAPGSPEAWRQGQAKDVVDSITGIDVLMGDFNSSKIYTFFAERGLADARTKAATVVDAAYRSTHPYGKRTPKDGRWIDNVLTAAGVKVRKVWLVMTGVESPYPNASDHNAVAATIEI